MKHMRHTAARVLLVFLAAFRSFALIAADPLIAFKCPFNLNCVECATFGKVCEWNCYLRRLLKMDLTEYMKVDVVCARRDIESQIIGFEAIILSVLIITASIGMVFKRRWANNLGFTCFGLYVFLLGPLFYKGFKQSPNPFQLLLFNFLDVVYTIVILLCSLFLKDWVSSGYNRIV
ncbi:hypothetical protein AKO1_015305 [Acrasis kona]|uniref:Uncharacterized protein n=1 Tax=Acrasis kona TaxID=1008807 RepID=A0AAW2ZGT3_9EUKA